jgi:hypothetical protein
LFKNAGFPFLRSSASTHPTAFLPLLQLPTTDYGSIGRRARLRVSFCLIGVDGKMFVCSMKKKKFRLTIPL